MGAPKAGAWCPLRAGGRNAIAEIRDARSAKAHSCRLLNPLLVRFEPRAAAGRVWNYCSDRVFEWRGFRQRGGAEPFFRSMMRICLPYDDDDLQIVCLEGRGADILVITFSSLGMFKPGGMTMADGHVFWGRQLIEKSGMSAIGFVAKRPHWFMTRGMFGAINAAKVRTARYRHVVSYGSSMGGFAALKYSLALGCTSAIACGPQSTLEREALPALDHRYQHYFHGDLHRDMDIKSQDVCEGAYLIFDPFCSLDGMHAAKIKAQAPQVGLVPAYFAGHECVRIFASTEIATQLINLGTTTDLSGLRAFTRKVRRRAPVRALELALRAMNRRPALSETIYAKYKESLDLGQRNAYLAALKRQKITVP